MWETLITDYWGLLGSFAFGVLYLVMHRGLAMSQAKKTAMTLMLAAEKKAEQLILITGQDKFNWVIDKGYDLMPAALRIFIGKPAFRMIVQELFDGTVRTAKQYIEELPRSGDGPTAGRSPSAGIGMPPVPPIPQLALPLAGSAAQQAQGGGEHEIASAATAVQAPGAVTSSARIQDGAPV
jgi:hypothetical protein